MSAPTTRPPADRQRALLARLGLDERATPEDVADIHDDLVAFLTTAPKSLRTWARTQAAAADEAFALLTDPDAPAVTGALSAPAALPTVQPDGPATPPARRASSTAKAVPPPTIDVETSEPSFEEMLAEVTPGTHRESLAKSGSGHARTNTTKDDTTPATGASRRGNGPSLRRIALVGLAVVAVVAVAFTGYQLGATPSTAADLQASPAPQASPALDQALIADLMTKVAADPKNVDAMLQLGDAFYRGEDFGAAVTWFGKALEVDGTSARARLALGAAYFNLGDMAGAETAWLAVVKQDPENVEAHYDLGFLFLNRDPADMDGVRREWGEVVRLAPDSDVAKTVKAHLDALSSPAPSAAPSGAPSTAPSTPPSAAPSGAPSAAPSAAPVQP